VLKELNLSSSLLLKLEIGAGTKPQKDKSWIHQDIRNLPGIDLVCDAKKLPFNDNELEEVFSSHVIEHFSWREVKGVLVEWLRVLKKGGLLEIVTPDFFRLWSNLILQTEIPKYGNWRGGPVDSAFVAYVTGGGQDYPENTHTAHYTDQWYKETLKGLNCKVEVKHHGSWSPSPSIRILAIKL
jgi:ubiquinone/menaquinone biosynthesis C-methylase UbiE